MKPSMMQTLLLCALCTATAVSANDDAMTAQAGRNVAEPGVDARWSDRALARVQDWMSRVRGRITGSGDHSMPGCGGMMSAMPMMHGGGMNSVQPNDQWRNPAQPSRHNLQP